MKYLLTPVLLLFCLLTPTFVSFGQEKDKEKKPKLTSDAKQARDYALGILDEIKEIMKEYYYDQKYRGMDLKARIDTAKARVKTLEYNWQMYRVIAQVLMELDDSHTNFLLPPRSDHFQYGISWQMMGDDCFITSVKKGSDAAAQGLETGDQVLMIRNFRPTRADLWKMNYVIYRLDPLSTMDLKIRKPDGTEKSLTIKGRTLTDKEYAAELKARKEKFKEKFEPSKCQEVNKDLIACKLYSFTVEKSAIDKMMKQAHKYPKMILDLRQNGGGYVSIEEYLVSHFFDHEVKIADIVLKDKKELRRTKVLDASKQYKGDVTILIDSNSASAAEITARVLQLEKRAKVYGDFSSGSVMTSIAVPFTSVVSQFALFAMIRVGMSVTIADVIMSDGSRLEKTGVTPDIVLQPTGLAMKQKMDPVLFFAAAKNGAQLSPADAGKFYFLFSKADDVDEGDPDGE
jgi:C-terminal processing protease CtpA/Prc